MEMEEDRASMEAAKAWQKKKAAKGLRAYHLAERSGRPRRHADAADHLQPGRRQIRRVAPGAPFAIGLGMCIPTLMALRLEGQHRALCEARAAGDEIWCQLFSEPAGGSDVAGLRTRAEKHGDEWTINGQKIWTSGAHYSDYGIVLTRTDPTCRSTRA
jgi:alkylation response protein AidB-like acyl-CoA dehydrogenase